MALTPTNKFINVSSVGFTPSGGSLTSIKGVKSITLNPNAQALKDSADGDLFNTFAGVVGLDYVVDVVVNIPMTLNAITPGVAGTLVFTANDARNAAVTAGGAQVFTVSNCVFQPQTMNLTHRQLGTNSYQFDTWSTDGVTNPVSVAAA